MTTSSPAAVLAQSPAPGVPLLMRRVFWANLIAHVAIIVTGGIVRLSGSGLGCPTWPECVPGSFVPVREQEQGWHKAVEFGNRTLTGVLLLLAVAVLVLAYAKLPFPQWRLWPASVKRFFDRLPQRLSLRMPAALVFFGVIAQAVIGGITVLTGLSPLTVGIHFMVSALLVAISMWLVLALDRPAGRLTWDVPPIVGGMAVACAAVCAVVLALGTVVTGSGPHAGDADKPVRYGLDPRTVSWLHADAVMIFAGLVIGLWVISVVLKRPVAARAWRAVALVTAAQGLLGYAQYLAGVPALMVLAHMTLASILVCVVTWGVVALLAPVRDISADA